MDFNPYIEEEIKCTSYKLLEKYNGSQLFGIVFEVKGEIVGGILGLEEYSPGISSLDRDDIPKAEQ